MGTVDLDDTSKSLDNSCVLNIGILTIFKRLALFDEHIKDLQSTNLSF